MSRNEVATMTAYALALISTGNVMLEKKCDAVEAWNSETLRHREYLLENGVAAELAFVIVDYSWGQFSYRLSAHNHLSMKG